MSYHSIVTTKGQLVIPIEIRKKFGIKTGTKILFSDSGGKIFLEPVTDRTIDENIGILRSDGNLLENLINSEGKNE